MKKMWLAVALTAGMLWSVNAQEVKFGVKAGMNLSTLGGDLKDYMDMDQKNHVGFHIGAFVDWGLTENFYIQPGLFYTNKGVREEFKDEDYSLKLKVNLSYLEIPVLASYRIGISDNMKWHINAGPYLAYGLGGKFKYEGGEDGDDDEKAFDEDEGDLKRFDFGLSFGTGVSFNAFYVGLKYDLGLVNIAGDAWENEDGSAKIKNRNFAISVGYTF